MSEARAWFMAGQYQKGENVLFALNLSAPSSVEWNMEAAHRLTALALAFRSEGEAGHSSALAQRALEQLALAANKATSAGPAVRARVETMVGSVNERLLGTTAQAKARYRAALDLDPGAKRAAEALKRLDRAGAQGTSKS